MNKHYQKGVRFERTLLLAAKRLGCEATRSAGSHGKWDITVHCPDMEHHRRWAEQFNWLSTPPKHPFFDWTCRWPHGHQEKLCYIKVIHDDQQGEWIYLIQAKVKQ
jgi:hypothetical protein